MNEVDSERQIGRVAKGEVYPHRTVPFLNGGKGMLYIGHFSFNGFEEDPKHGYFTCLVDANGVEESLDRFRNLLSKLANNSDLFRDVSSVYLDVVTEVKEIPPVAFLAHMVTRGGELAPSISTSLPEPDKRYWEAFAVAPDSDDDETVEITPFMNFV